MWAERISTSTDREMVLSVRMAVFCHQLSKLSCDLTFLHSIVATPEFGRLKRQDIS